jgi:hypothetical protein
MRYANTKLFQLIIKNTNKTYCMLLNENLSLCVVRKTSCFIRNGNAFPLWLECGSQVYFPAPPQSGNPVVLLQMAVRLTVEVLIIILVRVDTPNANKNRFASVPSGSENPA